MELTTLPGWLKQIKTERLDGHSRELIDCCFLEFLGQGQVSSWLKAPDVSFSVTSKGTFPTSHGRLRRFAGDHTLPGGRYFSVCNDESGADGGTRVWELVSYWTSHAKFFPNLIDSTVHTKEAEELRRSHPHLFGSANFLLLGAAEIQSVALEDGRPVIKLGTQIAKMLPLDVAKVEIARVLDLRLPSGQQWFTDTFGKLEVDVGHSNEFGISTGKDYPARFRDVLPYTDHPLSRWERLPSSCWRVASLWSRVSFSSPLISMCSGDCVDQKKSRGGGMTCSGRSVQAAVGSRRSGSYDLVLVSTSPGAVRFAYDMFRNVDG